MDPHVEPVAGGLVPSTAFVERRHASTEHAVFVVVPWRRFFAIDGLGTPFSADYDVASSVLRATLMECERLIRRDRFVPGPFRRAVTETLWWQPQETAANGPDAFVDRSKWHWRQLLEIPDEAIDAQVEEAVASGRPGLARHFAFAEGPVAQWLHVGDSDGEISSIRRLFEAIADAGYVPVGPLHHLALVDSRSVPRGRGRSIFRQPIG